MRRSKRELVEERVSERWNRRERERRSCDDYRGREGGGEREERQKKNWRRQCCVVFLE